MKRVYSSEAHIKADGIIKQYNFKNIKGSDPHIYRLNITSEYYFNIDLFYDEPEYFIQKNKIITRHTESEFTKLLTIELHTTNFNNRLTKELKS